MPSWPAQDDWYDQLLALAHVVRRLRVDLAAEMDELVPAPECFRMNSDAIISEASRPLPFFSDFKPCNFPAIRAFLIVKQPTKIK